VATYRAVDNGAIILWYKFHNTILNTLEGCECPDATPEYTTTIVLWRRHL
jgi:hypothetical protein